MKPYISLLLCLISIACDHSQNSGSSVSYHNSEKRPWKKILAHKSSGVFFDEARSFVETEKQLLRNYLKFIQNRESQGQTAGSASLAHQDDLLGVFQQVPAQTLQSLDFDRSSYQFGVIASDLGKLSIYKSLFLEKSEKSDLLLDVLTGRSKLPTSKILKDIVNGFIFNPDFTNDQIRDLFVKFPVLTGYFHELPGLGDMIIAFELGLIEQDLFEKLIKVNLYHNGPSAGFWKVFSFKIVPKILGDQSETLKRLLKEGPFSYVKSEGFGSEGPGYPDSLTFEAQVHRIFDRVSQGSRGGLIKMFHEYQSPMDERLIEFIHLVVPRTIRQLTYIESSLSDTALSSAQKSFLQKQIRQSGHYLKLLAMTLKKLVPVVKKDYVFMARSVQSLSAFPNPEDYQPSELSDDEIIKRARDFASRPESIDLQSGFQRISTADQKKITEVWVGLIEGFEHKFGNPMLFVND